MAGMLEMIPKLSGGTAFVGGIALFSIVGTFWSKIKAFTLKLYSFFVVTGSISGGGGDGRDLSRAFATMLWQEYKVVGLRTWTYEGERVYRMSKRRRLLTGFECLSKDSMIFRKGWKFLFVKNCDNNSEGLSFSFVRGTFTCDKLIEKAINLYNNRFMSGTNDRFYVRKWQGSFGMKDKDNNVSPCETEDESGSEGSYWSRRPVGCSKSEIGYKSSGEKREIYILDNKLESAMREAKFWLDNREWYIERGIPWKRGWLMYGVPGTGKTSFVRCLGRELDMPVNVFDLSTYHNYSFVNDWSRLSSRTPCFALFEDIDTTFNGRRNVHTTDIDRGLTFDCFLNCLDGIEETDGIFTILTANNIDMIDDALCGGSGLHNRQPTRPGRIDKLIEVRDLDFERRISLAKIILSDFPDIVEPIAIEGDGDTGAQFTNRCCVRAEKLFWKRKYGDEMGEIREEEKGYERVIQNSSTG